MSPRRYLAVLALTAVVGFALVWAWVAAMPLAYLDPEYPAWRAKLDLLRRCDLGDVLVVGDSRAAVDVMPALLPVRATNLAVGGGETIEAYVALSRALACPVPPRRVVISLDAGAFHPAGPVLGALGAFRVPRRRGPGGAAASRAADRRLQLCRAATAGRPAGARCARGCTPGVSRRCISTA